MNAKDYLSKVSLINDSDFMDTGMVNFIAELCERYYDHRESIRLKKEQVNHINCNLDRVCHRNINKDCNYYCEYFKKS